MWIDNDKIMVVLDAANEGKSHFPCVCPICEKKSAHIYIHRHDNRHCGIWTWCSSCGSYSHMSGRTPKWWKNPDFVDVNQLCSEPEYLEKISDKIDTWTNNILLDKKAFYEKPLILENKFKVKLLFDYQGIPAGTIGTLIIKDDFKNIKVDFINGESNNKINLKIQSERVTSLFEVIK